VSGHATTEDCPCCHECLAPGLDTDRALVVAFVAGIAAHDDNVPMAEALCAKHSALTRECLGFVLDQVRKGTGGAS
jgi:hypothetical protein